MSLWMKSDVVTIHMKATEQYFSVVLFIIHRIGWFYLLRFPLKF